MNKEFIPYEQALELKELGFDEECFRLFNKNGNIEPVLSIDTNKNSDRIVLFSERTTAPLYQQAFRWFREKYNQFHSINQQIVISKDGNYLRFFFTIKEPMQTVYDSGSNDIYFNTYEEAELECIKKLIKIVKNK